MVHSRPDLKSCCKTEMACGMDRCFWYTNNYMVNNYMVSDLPCEEVLVLPR